MAEKPQYPSPWHPKSSPCPPVLGITLHRPWSWAFFHGGPGVWKDVENRRESFPEVPAGTWLAIHNGTCWDEAAERTIRERVPAARTLRLEDCPAGWVVGLVRVEKVTRGALLLPRQSRWFLDWGTGLWLAEERIRLSVPLACPRGWFGAWKLPEASLETLMAEVRRAYPGTLASAEAAHA